MFRNKLRTALLCAVLVGCSSLPTNRALVQPRALDADHVEIWRGVKLIGHTSKILWTDKSFGVSGKPHPGLSLVNEPTKAQPCWLRVTVHVPRIPVHLGDRGEIGLTVPDLPVGKGVPPGPVPSPWIAVFDNEAEGHWSILKHDFAAAAPNNTVAGNWAAKAFQASTAAGEVTIVNGEGKVCEF